MKSELKAQSDKTRVLIVLDGSFSMRKNWEGSPKWDIARSAIIEIADSFRRIGNVEMGIRVFGHQFNENEKECKDTKLEIPIGRINLEAMERKLEVIRPKGITPIMNTLEKAPSDFSAESNSKNILILITDGEEACSGDICKISIELQRKNIVLKPFVIGLGLPENAFASFQCAGEFYNANNPAQFKEILAKVSSDAVAKTTIQLSLLNRENAAVETDVAFTFFDQKTGIAKYHFIHALNAYGLPDTFEVTPSILYKLKVHTIPPIEIENIKLERYKHNIVEIPASQGFLKIELQGNMSKPELFDRIKTLVREDVEVKTLNIQRLYETAKYLAGNYNIEILTLPRIKMDNVKIDQNKTTTIKIPAPGIITLNKTYDVYGGIFMIEGKKMVKLYDLKSNVKMETVALQPGKYRLVYRSKNSKTIHTTVDKEIEIISGGSLSLKL